MIAGAWQRLGRIVDPEKILPKGYSYSAVPIVMAINEDLNLFQLMFSARDFKGRSCPFSIWIDMRTLEPVGKVQGPLLTSGELGCFDDSGVMPTCYMKFGDLHYLYYIGWNLGVTVPFRNAIGLAISSDNGLTFSRMFKGPILDRTPAEPFFVASCDVVPCGQGFEMYYLACVDWQLKDGIPVHRYHIRMAKSIDGINWQRDGFPVIDFNYENEYAISVPRVIDFFGDRYMFYSYRGGPISNNYQLGWAMFNDNTKLWERNDLTFSFDKPEEEWDSQMQCYPYVFQMKSDYYLLYNGNHFGKSGIGIAKFIKNENRF